MKNMHSYNDKNNFTHKRKILIRAGFNPTKKYNIPIDFLINNMIGTNTGNLLFAYGAMNVLWTDGIEIEHVYDKLNFSDEETSAINNNYEAFVLPLADAFRVQFIPFLKSYTSLIKRIKIPVVVLGVGYRTTYEPKFESNSLLDDAVKDFVKAVLDHSTALGLRGMITGAYLKKLGFKEDRDFIPIGCPSLYTYGDNTCIRSIPSSDRIISGKLLFNMNTWAFHNYNEYIPQINLLIQDAIEKIPDHFLIQQLKDEIKRIYWGGRYSSLSNESIVATDKMKCLFENNRVKCFFDVPSWINFCKDADLFVGNRFHGTVAAILAGVPHIFLPFDGRTRELSEHHHLTSIMPHIINGNYDILKYFQELDFTSFNKFHKFNSINFIEFLEKNGLHHIFEFRSGYNFGESPMEQRINFAYKEICTIDSLSIANKAVRYIKSIPYFINRIASFINYHSRCS